MQCDVRFNNDRSLTYSCSYSPKQEGNHKVYIRFAGREIPKSPYVVLVEGHAGDPSKVTASGPGLQPEGNMVNRPTYFDISTKGTRLGLPLAAQRSRQPAGRHAKRLRREYRRGDVMGGVMGSASLRRYPRLREPASEAYLHTAR